MENYFGVPEFLGGQEGDVNIMGVRRPLESLVAAPLCVTGRHGTKEVAFTYPCAEYRQSLRGAKPCI